MNATRMRRASALTAAGVAAGALVAASAAAPAIADPAPPPCKITDLSVTLGRLDSGAGQRYTTLDFLTHGGRTCVLSDNLTNFQFLGARAKPLPTEAHAPGSDTRITLSPGVMGHLNLHWTVMDGEQFVPVSLIFTMPADDGTNAVVWNGEPVSGAGRLDVWGLHL